jgi:sugar lactone lactonase YvrE
VGGKTHHDSGKGRPSAVKNMGPWRAVAASLAAALLSSACAATAPAPTRAVFFPPAPALPRLQYLTHYTGRKDIEQQTTFNRFIVGEVQDQILDKPYGVAMHDGKIYVCDTNATVTVFDLEKKTFSFLEGALGNGLLRQPVNISITADGTKYVSDPVRGQVVAFDRNDQFVTAYGSPSDWKPVDAVVWEDRLYAADMDHGAIKVFDTKTGELVKSFGDKGEGDARLARPSNLAFDSQGFLYVTDIGRFQVVKLDREGVFQKAFGRLGDNLGHFARPKGVAVDRNGLVYVVDAAFNNVQIFTREGRLATFFGGPGTEPGTLTLPAKVAIDYDNIERFRAFVQPGFRVEYLVLVTSQFGDRRVNVFAYGQEDGRKYPTDEELLRQIEERRAKTLGAPAAP